MRTLVLEGGGMRGAFSAGFLAGLKKHGFDYAFFDNYVGTSAGACTMAYFLTDQTDTIVRAWEEHVPDRFINHKGLSFKEHVDFMEKIFREIDPLSISTLAKRKQKAFTVLTDFSTMHSEYPCLNDSPDPIQLLLASINWPLFQPPTRIGHHLYYDGGLTSAIPLEKADMLKSDETWIVLTTPLGYRRKQWKYWLASLLALHNKQLFKAILRRPVLYNKIIDEIENRKDLVVIRPEQHLPLHWRKTDPALIKETIMLGMRAAEKIISERKLKVA